jgi:hypothetical protein
MSFYAKDDPACPVAEGPETATLSRAQKPRPRNAIPPILTVGIGHRFYNPGLGRWVSRDSINGPVLSAYVLVANNPAMLLDVLGLSAEEGPPTGYPTPIETGWWLGMAVSKLIDKLFAIDESELVWNEKDPEKLCKPPMKPCDVFVKWTQEYATVDVQVAHWSTTFKYWSRREKERESRCCLECPPLQDDPPSKELLRERSGTYNDLPNAGIVGKMYGFLVLYSMKWYRETRTQRALVTGI